MGGEGSNKVTRPTAGASNGSQTQSKRSCHYYLLAGNHFPLGAKETYSEAKKRLLFFYACWWVITPT